MQTTSIDSPRHPQFRLLISLLVILVPAGVGCVPPPALPPATPVLPNLGGREVVVAVVVDNLPFSRFDDATGATEGFDVDLITAMAQKLNLQLRFVALDVDAAVSNLNARTYEMVAGGIFYTLDRTKQVDFAVPYALAKQRLAVRASDSRAADIAAFRDQDELTIGSVPGTIGFELAQSYFGQSRMRSYVSSAVAMDALAMEEIDGVVLKSTDFEAGEQTRPGVFRALRGALAGNLKAFALRLGSDLTDPVNLALNELLIEGTISALRNKWGF